jgi:hypothetical protein
MAQVETAGPRTKGRKLSFAGKLRRALQKRSATHVKYDLLFWDYGGAVPDAQRRTLRRKFLQNQNRIWYARTVASALVTIVGIVAVTLICVLNIIIAANLQSFGLDFITTGDVMLWVIPVPHTLIWVLCWWAFFVLLILFWIPIDFANRVFGIDPDTLDIVMGIAFFTIWIIGIGGVTIYFTAVGRPLSLSGQAVFVALLGMAIAPLVLLIFIVFVNPFSNLVRRLPESKYPNEYVVHRLFEAIKAVKFTTTEWYKSTHSFLALTCIDKAADVIEHRALSRLVVSNPGLRIWRDDNARSIANALREKERRILFPNEMTREEIASELTETMINVLTDRWEDLATAEDVPIPSRSRYIVIFATMRSIFIAVMPAILFIGVTRWSLFHFDQHVESYVAVGLLVWAALSLAAAFDPLLSDKVSAFKDVLSIFRGSEKKAGAQE